MRQGATDVELVAIIKDGIWWKPWGHGLSRDVIPLNRVMSEVASSPLPTPLCWLGSWVVQSVLAGSQLVPNSARSGTVAALSPRRKYGRGIHR